MNTSRMKVLVPGLVLALLMGAVLSAQDQKTPVKGPLQTADGVVSELYRLVCFKAGESADWDKVKSLFLKQAVVVLRTARDKTTVFTVDSFVEDFVRFAERPDVKAKGFTERIVRSKSLVFGDMAHVLVLYEAQITGSQRPPQQGVDSFQLIKKDGRWWIVSVTNEIVTPSRPIPPELAR